jgi:hypothetical protein
LSDIVTEQEDKTNPAGVVSGIEFDVGLQVKAVIVGGGGGGGLIIILMVTPGV